MKHYCFLGAFFVVRFYNIENNQSFMSVSIPKNKANSVKKCRVKIIRKQNGPSLDVTQVSWVKVQWLKSEPKI